VTAAELFAHLKRELPPDPEDQREWRPDWRLARLPKCLAVSKYGHIEEGVKFWGLDAEVFIRPPHRSCGVCVTVNDPGGIAVIEQVKGVDVVRLHRFDVFVHPDTRYIQDEWVTPAIRDAVRYAWLLRRGAHAPAWAKPQH
jgi:hypothetical protein